MRNNGGMVKARPVAILVFGTLLIAACAAAPEPTAPPATGGTPSRAPASPASPGSASSASPAPPDPSASPVATGAVAASAVRLLLDGPLDRIGECASCCWLFLDTSRGGRRRWCSMAVCGARVKARRYYANSTG